MAEPIRPAGNGGNSARDMLRELAYPTYAAERNMQSHRAAQATQDTLREVKSTNELLNLLVQSSVEQDARERRMLRWTIVSALCAAVAAVGAVLALILR